MTMIEELKMAKQAYDNALLTGIGVSRAKERMMNMAFNHYDELLQAAEECTALREENEMLRQAVVKACEDAKPAAAAKAAGNGNTGRRRNAS